MSNKCKIDFQSTYVGCYKDNGDRALPIVSSYMTIDKCNAEAKKNKSKFFGMQDVQLSGIAQCTYGDSKLSMKDIEKYGIENCNKYEDNYRYGGPWINAVYETV